jgi:hypothetical protein
MFGVQLLIYICQVATIVLLLWLWILIFMDPDLQRGWKRGTLGRIMRRKPIFFMMWTLVFAVIVAFPYVIMILILYSMRNRLTDYSDQSPAKAFSQLAG